MSWLKSGAVSAALWAVVAAVSAQEVKPLLGVPFGSAFKLTTRCPFNSEPRKRGIQAGAAHAGAL